MASSIDPECELILYADNSSVLISQKKNILKRCSQWLVDNKLSLHLGKTECILFGTRKELSNVQDFYIECNNRTINSTDKVTYLGVFIEWEIYF